MIATLIVLAELYLVVGAVVAVALFARGLAVIDGNVPGSTWGFRLLILPGILAFWPVLVGRWIREGGSR